MAKGNIRLLVTAGCTSGPADWANAMPAGAKPRDDIVCPEPFVFLTWERPGRLFKCPFRRLVVTNSKFCRSW